MSRWERRIGASRLAAGLAIMQGLLSIAGAAAAQEPGAAAASDEPGLVGEPGTGERGEDDADASTDATPPGSTPEVGPSPPREPSEEDASRGAENESGDEEDAGAEENAGAEESAGAVDAEANDAEQAAEAEGPPPSWTDFIHVRGFGAIWITPHRGNVHPSSDRPVDFFHLRFARVMVTATPIPELSANAVIGLEASNMIFNFQLSYVGSEWLNITAGQYRIPFGAAINTPAFRLRNFDRPRYVYVMSKQALRDLGVTLHSPRGGILDGAIEYAVGMFNGEGRIREGITAGERDFQDYFFSGRLVFNPGTWFLPARGRLALGGSLAHAVDPAAGPDMTTARENAVFHLGGRLTPFTLDRETWLVGADLTFSAFGVWLQAEMIYLSSASLDGTASVDALGWSVEGGYLVDVIRTMLVGRFETLDRNLDSEGTTSMTFSVGARVRPVDHIYLGAYYLHVEYQPVAGSNAFASDDRVRIETGIEFL